MLFFYVGICLKYHIFPTVPGVIFPIDFSKVEILDGSERLSHHLMSKALQVSGVAGLGRSSVG